MADQILEFARTLARSGLLEDITADADATDVDDEELSALGVGEAVESFTLPDLDGAPVSLDAWSGRRILLVNWRATCGYCRRAAPELARAQAGLAARGVDLVLVSSGDADENRRLLDETGLRAPVLLKRDVVDPFGGLGTPAAYLLDVDGRVAEPLAYGSAEVPRLAAELAGLDDDGDDSGPGPGSLDAVEYLPAPRPVCGSGGGGAGPDGSGGTRAYRIGRYHVGVGYDSPAAAELLDRLFAGARVHDRRVPDNYSVMLQPDHAGWPRPLNLLVRGGAQVVRSRSVARTLRALVSYLSAETAPPDPACWSVRATAVVHDGRAVLLPRGLRGWIKDLAPRLGRRGTTFVDSPFAAVDPVTAELVVPALSVAHDVSLLIDPELDGGSTRDRSFVEPGRYPISAWHLAGEAEEPGRQTAGWAIANAYPLVQADDDPARVGEHLLALFERVPASALAYTTPDDVTRQFGSGS
jgi:peroxiredoxin